jgi:peptide/nickel transport system permease protein
MLTLIFVLFAVMPGDPAQMILGQHENEEQLQNIKFECGLDLPIWQQYLYWINDLSPISIHHKNHVSEWNKDKYTGLKFSVGQKSEIGLKVPYLRKSFQKKGQKVASIMAPKILNTFILAFTSISIAFIGGILIGIFLQRNSNFITQQIVEVLSYLGMALPSFFSSILIAWFFGYYLSDYLPFEMTGSLISVDDYGNGEYIDIKNLILPAITLGIRPLAVISQLTKTSLEQELKEDYIRTAFSKGLSRKKVLWKHALKNALNPVITATSGWFASLLAGAVFVEYIFAWDGIGKLLVESLEQLDLPLIMGIVLFIAIVFMCINIFVDFIYKLLDPRIR